MSQFMPYSVYGIIGYPLGHSMSPLIHTTSFQDYGIPAVLVPFPVPLTEISVLVNSVKLLNIRGLCVTIPHKQSIIAYLDKVTDRVKKAGAANLIYWDNDKLCGDNTDIIGFIEPLQRKKLPDSYQQVLVLGAGGAARAIVVGLQELGYTDITVTGTTLDNAIALANDFNLKVISWSERGNVDAQIIINTTPLGMKGSFEKETPYQQAWFKGQGIAYDIVYTPHYTRFRKEAEKAGWASLSGLDMFIGQANAQFKIWTGKSLSEHAKKIVIETLSTQ